MDRQSCENVKHLPAYRQERLPSRFNGELRALRRCLLTKLHLRKSGTTASPGHPGTYYLIIWIVTILPMPLPANRR